MLLYLCQLIGWGGVLMTAFLPAFLVNNATVKLLAILIAVIKIWTSNSSKG